MASKNIVLSAFDNELKKDYLLSSPFAKTIACTDNAQELLKQYINLKNESAIIAQNYNLAKEYSFEKLAELYTKLIKES